MNFQYEIKNSRRARRVSIAVYPDGRVVVSKPARISAKYARQFLLSKQHWVAKKISNQEKRVRLSAHNLSRGEILERIQQRIAHYNQHYGFEVGRISVKNHKTLWGSCSKNKNLNFNHQIASLNQEQMDYIIVHELCHLKEFNHSQKFWDLVTESIPNYKLIRRQLKQYKFV